MIVIYMVLSFIGWIFVATLFEHTFSAGGGREYVTMARYEACRIFWCFVGIMAFAASGPPILLHLLTLLPVAASHVDLSRGSVEAIHWHDILRRIWTGAREAIGQCR